jgi:phage-related minor tail protein
MDERVVVSVEADTEPFRQSLETLQKMAASLGTQLTGALKGAAIDGRNLDDVLRGIATSLAGMALRQGLQPLNAVVGGLMGQLAGGIGSILPFAKGGVVTSPVHFPLSGGLGVAGEAGAEAILPLRRGPDGRLGVDAGGGRSVNITFNVTATDAASFRKSEAQVAAMLARTVSRGMRST